VEALDLRRRIVVAELSVAGLAGGSLGVVQSVPPPRFQPIERDLTVDVADRVPAAEVARRIRVAGVPLLEDAVLVGTYRGQPLAADQRSLTFRIRFGAADRALVDHEVDAALAAISGALEQHVGARIRS
jgi:phenylalanyl-tRNA synthetase beta chain